MDLLKTKPNLDDFDVKLSKLETAYDITLPSDFKSFIQSSGTTAWLTDKEYDTDVLTIPLMFGNLFGIDDLLEYNDEYSDQLAPHSIFIGVEQNDGEFYLRQTGEHSYEYGFYDSTYILSEYMADENDINDDIDEKMNEKNTHFLANSFKDFLDIWYEFNE